MQSKKYKFFDTVIKLTTPENIEASEPYTLFLTDDEPKYFVDFQYVSELPKVPKSATVNSELAFCDNGDVTECWYKKHGSDDFFAYRISENNMSTVKIIDEFRGKLWNGVIFNLIGFEDIMARENSFVLHGSMVKKNGKTVIFTAPCGTGKSTQATLWEKFADAEIINGDKALVKIENGVAVAGGLIFSGSSNICKNISAPVCAVVRLGQAKENILRKMSKTEAFISLLQGNYRTAVSEFASQKITDAVEGVCNSVPVYKLDCLPDESAVRCLEKELEL